MSHLKTTIFGIINELLSTQNVNVARFARNFEWDFFCCFQSPCFVYPCKTLWEIQDVGLGSTLFLCIGRCSLYRYWDQRSFRISINIEEHYKFTPEPTSNLQAFFMHIIIAIRVQFEKLNFLFFYFLHEVHFRFRCTCKKLWYLYSRPHLGQIWTCFPSPGIELATFFNFLVSRKDFNLSARRVIWPLKSIIILGWTTGGSDVCSTSTISRMATSKGLAVCLASCTSCSLAALVYQHKSKVVVVGSRCKITSLVGSFLCSFLISSDNMNCWPPWTIYSKIGFTKSALYCICLLTGLLLLSFRFCFISLAAGWFGWCLRMCPLSLSRAVKADWQLWQR